jgi:hypothetical protein
MTDFFKIHVIKGWVVPPCVKQITPAEWVIWLESIAKILTETEGRLSKTHVENIREQIDNELKYEREKIDAEHKTNAKNLIETNKKLEIQLAEMKKSNDTALSRNEQILAERYTREIKTLRDTLEVFEKKNNELLEQLGNAQKQTIKYFEDRKQELETFYRTNFFKEQELLENERTKISGERAELLAEQKNLLVERKKLENDLYTMESQIKESVAQTYEDKLAFMSETIETLKQTNVMQQSLEQTCRDIQTTIQPIKKMYHGSNEEKGSSGEKSVFDFIAGCLRIP